MGEDAGRDTDADYRALFDASPLATLVVHQPSDRILVANEAACRLYGCTRPELLRLTAGELRIDPAASPQRHRRKDGSRFDAEVSSQAVEFLRRPCRVDVITDVTERERLARELRESEERYRRLFDSGPLPKFLYDVATLRFVDVNQLALDHYGWTRDEVLAMSLADLRVLDGPPPGAGAAVSLHRHRKKDGTLIDVEIASQLLTLDGRLVMLMAVNDVSARQKLREQLVQSQKMEAVGRLAGGVAHDFNNLLAVILVISESVAHELGEQHRLFPDVEDIRTAAARAGALTRQLLAFSRQQVLTLRVLSLAEVLGDIEKMLRRVIGEDIHIDVELGPEPPAVRADLGQLEQVLLNLAVNARDAMPHGGTLRLSGGEELVDAARAQALDVEPGRYAALGVADDGMGMDATTRARIFEPFFTTKERGKGTGLGLSTAFGIVKQLGGAIAVDSAPGRGARFTVLLPIVAAGVAPSASASGSGPLPVALPGETVLVVEDDEAVRGAVRRVLRGRGYQVLDAPSGAAALRIAAEHRGRLDLLLTDLVMPDVDGRTISALLCQRHPRLKVLLMSGYDEHPSLDGQPRDGGGFLPKPFSAETLVETVRRVLDGQI